MRNPIFLQFWSFDCQIIWIRFVSLFMCIFVSVGGWWVFLNWFWNRPNRFVMWSGIRWLMIAIYVYSRIVFLQMCYCFFLLFFSFVHFCITSLPRKSKSKTQSTCWNWICHSECSTNHTQHTHTHTYIHTTTITM